MSLDLYIVSMQVYACMNAQTFEYRKYEWNNSHWPPRNAVPFLLYQPRPLFVTKINLLLRMWRGIEKPFVKLFPSNVPLFHSVKHLSMQLFFLFSFSPFLHLQLLTVKTRLRDSQRSHMTERAGRSRLRDVQAQLTVCVCVCVWVRVRVCGTKISEENAECHLSSGY